MTGAPTKRIAWILDTYPSISETFIARDIRALRDGGLTIEIFALTAGEGARPILKRGLLRGRWRSTGQPLGKALAREGFAHIHAGWASHPAEIAEAAATAASISWSFSAHARDLWVEGGDLARKLASASFAHCCTGAGAAHLAAISPGSRVIYAPHGLNLRDWPFTPREQNARPLLLGVGRLVPKKGWDIWLRALAQLYAEYPSLEWRALLIGDGPGRATLARLLAEFGLAGRVTLLGALPVSEVRLALTEAQLLVFAGRTDADGDRDGLPNVLLEAAACGTPIVASRAGAALEFGGEEELWTCPTEDPPALAAAMRRALTEWPESLARAKRARNLVEQRFQQDRAVAPLAGELRHILGTG